MQTSFASMGGSKGGGQPSAGGSMPQSGGQKSGGAAQAHHAMQLATEKSRIMDELRKIADAGKKAENEKDEIGRELAFIRARINECKISMRDIMNTYARLALSHGVTVNEHDPQQAIIEVRKNGAPEEDVLKMEKELKKYGEEQERLAGLQEKERELEKMQFQKKQKSEELNVDFKKKLEELKNIENEEAALHRDQNSVQRNIGVQQDDDGGMSMNMNGPGAGCFGGGSGGDGN